MPRRRSPRYSRRLSMGWVFFGCLLVAAGFTAGTLAIKDIDSGPLRLVAPVAQSLSGVVAVAWTVLVVVVMLAWVLKRLKRQRLFRQAQDLAALHRLGWADFERLVGEAYRHQGWRVEENGLGGADGGVDLFLRRSSRRGIVQVKHWKAKVGAPVVREQFGLLHHHKAQEVHIVALGGFTPQAEEFARGKPMFLVDGAGLLRMMGGQLPTPSPVLHPSPPKAAAVRPAVSKPPSCPSCGTPMVHRTRRSDGGLFWGCVRYPLCQGIRPITVR